MPVPSGDGQGHLGPAAADRDAAGQRAGQAPAQPRRLTDASTATQAARHKTTRMLPPGHKHLAGVRPLTGEASSILLPAIIQTDTAAERKQAACLAQSRSKVRPAPG